MFNVVVLLVTLVLVGVLVGYAAGGRLANLPSVPLRGPALGATSAAVTGPPMVQTSSMALSGRKERAWSNDPSSASRCRGPW